MLQLIPIAPFQADVEEYGIDDYGERCAPPVVHIHLLGTFRLMAENLALATIELPRLQSLFAYLAMHPEMAISRSLLASLFWPDSTEAQAHTNLRNLIHKLRQALLISDAGSFIRVGRQTVRWEPALPWTLDVLAFEQACARAEQARCMRDDAAEREYLEKAVSLYGGELLPGCYDEWIFPERDRLEQAYQTALERLIDLCERAGDCAAAIYDAQCFLRHDPLHEAAYRSLMRLYTAIGNRAAAMRMYQNCVAVLKRDLSVGPSSLTQALYRELLTAEESYQFANMRLVE